MLAPLASAHFKLAEPASWITENDLGDPQKLGPCGGTSANAGTVTNAVTKVQGGQKLHLKWTETVYHPGHYRIALSVNSRAELPADPPVQTKDSDKGPQSVTTATVSAFSSFASEATTGAAPVPVPPPRPAVTKTMSAKPSRISMILFGIFRARLDGLRLGQRRRRDHS